MIMSSPLLRFLLWNHEGHSPAFSGVSDDFDRTDQRLDASDNWEQPWDGPGSGAEPPSNEEIIRIVSNKVTVPNSYTGTYVSARWVGEWPDDLDDYYVEADVVIGASSEWNALGPTVRAAPTGSGQANVNGYALLGYGGDTFYLGRFTNGGAVVWQTWGTPTAGGTYTLRIECESDTIRGYIDGVHRLTLSDSTYATGLPGLACSRYGSTPNTARIDDWSADELS
jgi:hypothetical protein